MWTSGPCGKSCSTRSARPSSPNDRWRPRDEIQIFNDFTTSPPLHPPTPADRIQEVPQHNNNNKPLVMRPDDPASPRSGLAPLQIHPSPARPSPTLPRSSRFNLKVPRHPAASARETPIENAAASASRPTENAAATGDRRYAATPPSTRIAPAKNGEAERLRQFARKTNSRIGSNRMALGLTQP